jgi:HAD superfamily hydrolase (TIGR01490 family)
MPDAAAFFDVDRTLLAGASGFHLARPMRRHGLLTTRQLARSVVMGVAFSAQGTNHQQLDRFSETLRELVKGWKRETLERVVEEELETRVRPMVYREALERVALHRRQGQRVYAVSATMEEIIGPLAELLGFDGAIATRLEVGEDGRYTGNILAPNHGAQKADRLREFAAEHDIDLAASSAYSDSITDSEFLRAVGRPYAVNADKALRKLAEEEGWGILRFNTRVRARFHQRRGARVGMLALALAIRHVRRRNRSRRSA